MYTLTYFVVVDFEVESLETFIGSPELQMWILTLTFKPDQ